LDTKIEATGQSIPGAVAGESGGIQRRPRGTNCGEKNGLQKKKGRGGEKKLKECEDLFRKE